ncbi:hypothetical protein GCM10025771_14850 [Niveibacterium umoris]|uniref:Copper resistance protein CopC n=1 Tax=Niveibacterium umoris TaxID=1193620 RepID=A0A840BNS8_9RHOO|nr:hypothetical protein [Niveibacterium umoris]MBB4014640.1 hypothetical protein [Niveibacterium umoris]
MTTATARRQTVCSLLLTIALALAAGNACALDLITAEEAARPKADIPKMRGITRGPSVTQEAPAPDAASLVTPLTLKIAFKARGGAKIDPKTVEMTYLSTPPVDLLPRARAGVSASGIALTDVRMPPGTHPIRLRVSDSEGRETETFLKLDIAK